MHKSMRARSSGPVASKQTQIIAGPLVLNSWYKMFCRYDVFGSHQICCCAL